MFVVQFVYSFVTTVGIVCADQLIDWIQLKGICHADKHWQGREGMKLEVESVRIC